MAFLFYASYGNTNSQEILGAGVSRNDFSRTGSSMSIGMQDTIEGVYDGKFVNFWGLEDWWGLYSERIDNVISNEGKWDITEDDGTIRSIQGVSDSGYPSIMYIGEYLDMIPVSKEGSATSGYCDICGKEYTGYVITRSGYDKGDRCGISCIDFTSLASKNAYDSCRLAFRGTIIEESDPAVFKSLTAK